MLTLKKELAIIEKLLKQVRNFEKKTDKKKRRRDLENDIKHYIRIGKLDSRIKTEALANKIMEIKKIINFLEARIGQTGLFNVDKLVESAKKISNFEHKLLKLATLFLLKERQAENNPATRNIKTLPVLFQKNKQTGKSKALTKL